MFFAEPCFDARPFFVRLSGAVALGGADCFGAARTGACLRFSRFQRTLNHGAVSDV